MRVKALLQPRVLLEAFVWVNLAFLAPDIYLAHSVNAFSHWAEWIPLVFSLVAPVVLIVAWLLARPAPLTSLVLGWVLGLAAIVIGVAGMVFHLHDGFFVQTTLRNLVYTAPFVAPLAYAGIGLLILLNRTRTASDREWAEWVVVLALGGFVGNFVLSLADHAQNGFWVWEEWIPVFASALAVGCLTTVVVWRVDRVFLGGSAACMGLQMLVGVLGFFYHVAANLGGPSEQLFDNVVFGAPIFAPLLLPNIALLGLLGLWAVAISPHPNVAASDAPAIPPPAAV